MRHPALTLILGFILLAGCATTPKPVGSSGASTPEKTFNAVRDAILKGDLETVYGYYSTRKRSETSLEQLKQHYTVAREAWRVKYTNARMGLCSDDQKGHASLIIIYGDGQRLPVISMVYEGDTWRIDD